MELLAQLLIVAPVLLPAVILHEIAHGLAAEALGDPTARALGRITLNPLKHVDPFMTVILPLSLMLVGSPVIFGGAKPVPVDPRFFRSPRKGMGIVAIAGPLTNLALALLSLVAYKAIPPTLAEGSVIIAYLYTLLGTSVLINAVLCIFNLLPVPPLDGGRIMVALLPLPLARRWAKLERMGLLLVALLLLTGVVEKLLTPILDFVVGLLQ